MFATVIEKVSQNGGAAQGTFGWIGNIANLIVVVAFALVVIKWLAWRDWSRLKHPLRARLWEMFVPRSPVVVSYLLPKHRYHERKFCGATLDERHPTSLTIGIGTYDITVRVRANVELTLEQVRLAIDENSDVGDRPIQQGLVPSRFARTTEPDLLGRPRYVDWNGEVRLVDEFLSFPRHLARGDHALVTTRLRAEKDWDGRLAVVLLVRGYFTRSQVVKLPLAVSEHADQVRFLRVRPDEDLRADDPL